MTAAADWIAKRREIEQATSEQLPADARMDAYYYGFERTNCGPVDAILSAIATAGKRLHSTQDWAEELYGGAESNEAMIQRIAAESAAKIAAALDSLPRALDALEKVLELFPLDDPCPPRTCVHVDCEVQNAIAEALGVQP